MNAKLLIALWMLLLLLHSNYALADKFPELQVKPIWVLTHLNEVVILDVRGESKSYTQWGHIPGAQLVDWKSLRASRNIGDHKIDKLVLGKDAFEKLLREKGVNTNSAIVVTHMGRNPDDSTVGARLYWSLKYYGHDNVALLEGGNTAWAKQYPLEKKTPTVKPGSYKVSAVNAAILATSEDVEKALSNNHVQLVDTRSLDYYLGAVRKKSVARAGHIPGSKALPYYLMSSRGKPTYFHDPQLQTEIFEAMGIDPHAPTILYCNTGRVASSVWFVMHELLGNKQVKLYDGSMHEWSQKISHPLVRMKLE